MPSEFWGLSFPALGRTTKKPLHGLAKEVFLLTAHLDSGIAKDNAWPGWV